MQLEAATLNLSLHLTATESTTTPPPTPTHPTFPKKKFLFKSLYKTLTSL